MSQPITLLSDLAVSPSLECLESLEMDFKPFAEFINQVGFPVGVAIYLLWRISKHILRLSHTIDKLEGTVKHMSYLLEHTLEKRRDHHTGGK